MLLVATAKIQNGDKHKKIFKRDGSALLNNEVKDLYNLYIIERSIFPYLNIG